MKNDAGMAKDSAMKDGVMMEDDEMMMMKDGEKIPMDKEMSMSNGSKVMTDGTVVAKDGSKTTMKNGDKMNMSGDQVKSKKTKKMGKMKGM